nr:proline-rich receptor-like protein kinase PERK8 [Arachis hypogaea]
MRTQTRKKTAPPPRCEPLIFSAPSSSPSLPPQRLTVHPPSPTTAGGRRSRRTTSSRNHSTSPSNHLQPPAAAAVAVPLTPSLFPSLSSLFPPLSPLFPPQPLCATPYPLRVLSAPNQRTPLPTSLCLNLPPHSISNPHHTPPPAATSEPTTRYLPPVQTLAPPRTTEPSRTSLATVAPTIDEPRRPNPLLLPPRTTTQRISTPSCFDASPPRFHHRGTPLLRATVEPPDSLPVEHNTDAPHHFSLPRFSYTPVSLLCLRQQAQGSALVLISLPLHRCHCATALLGQLSCSSRSLTIINLLLPYPSSVPILLPSS